MTPGRSAASLASVAELIESLRALHLLDGGQLEALAKQKPGFADPQSLARSLIQRGWLSPYQVNQLFQGRGNDLLLGQYVLVERLGEGGMGEVFKARNWKTGQTAALKVIRKERLQSPTGARRFFREVQAAAQLSHPHVVRTFGAEQAGQAHFLAMEFIDGIDLARRVKQSGPMSVSQACDYVRQAALGLQHIHERGLVHRDIKPSNLFLTSGGLKPERSAGPIAGETIKILDLGVARMGEEDDETVSELTQEGAVVGTVDYLSPEQAVNSHQVDIRSDLYSLGCTFYFLLAGRAPFAGGMATEKLLKHRLDEPVPLEKVQPGVPEWVAMIVRKLMAKRPEDRYQTPAALIEALDAGAAPPQAQPSVMAVIERTWTPILQFARQHPRLTGVVLLLLALAVLVVLVRPGR